MGKLKYKEVLDNSIAKYPEMRRYFCKSYLSTANREFAKRHPNTPVSVEQSQAIYDIYEEQWSEYYVLRPQREKENKKKCEPLWNYGKSLHIDVYAACCRFIEHIYCKEWQDHWDGNRYAKISCGDIMKERNIEFQDGHIMDMGLLEDFKKWVKENKGTKLILAYHKPTYTDYSHLAYNGVTEDF